MLVLSRKTNESVLIGTDILVTVLEIRGDTVRLGIQAPRDVAVHREEVFEAIQEENRQAAGPTDEAVRSFAEKVRGERPSPDER